MSGIKKLAGQTLWYGLPTIASRFLGYLMNMALPFIVSMPEKTADLVQVYTLIPFLNVLYSYGLETAYFRFSQTHDREKIYQTLFASLIGSTVLFSILLWIFKEPLTGAADLENNPGYLLWMMAILAIDNLNTMPFARLRQEERPRRYAFARIAGILINLSVVVFFLGILPGYLKSHPDSFWQSMYNPKLGLGYYLAGNLAGSLFTMLFLLPEWKGIDFKIDWTLWKEAMRYSAPLIVVGLGGMINDVLSRLIYRHVVDLPKTQADHELGVFANLFRIALLITILIQAFRMAAEPFFFKQSRQDDAPKTYARVMKFFVIACCYMFLLLGLSLEVFRWIFTTYTSPDWAEGLDTVPLLALGNIFLGIYYNLSIWYKVTNKNLYGAMITIAGALVTIALNIWLIPKWHYTGAAMATYFCYLLMMLMSYVFGQRFYPVPYPVKKISFYLFLSLFLFLIHRALVHFAHPEWWLTMLAALLLLAIFTWFVKTLEQKEWAALTLMRGKKNLSGQPPAASSE